MTLFRYDTRGLISLWLYKETSYGTEKKIYLHIPPVLHTHLWFRCSNFLNPSKETFVVVLQIGKSKDLSAPLRTFMSVRKFYFIRGSHSDTKRQYMHVYLNVRSAQASRLGRPPLPIVVSRLSWGYVVRWNSCGPSEYCANNVPAVSSAGSSSIAESALNWANYTTTEADILSGTTILPVSRVRPSRQTRFELNFETTNPSCIRKESLYGKSAHPKGQIYWVTIDGVRMVNRIY
jgi:hypothetical protein